MTVRKWALACAGLVVGLVVGTGAGVAFAARSTPTVVFEVGGNASAAANSAGASWGQPVSVSSGSSYIVAVGDQQVMCRILVGGKLVAEAHAAGKGERASCAFG